jgi:hypothetical protein
MKKNRGHEPTQSIIHIYMDVAQRNSLCSYLKQAKISFVSLLQNQRTGGQNRSCLVELVTEGGMKTWKKGVGG